MFEILFKSLKVLGSFHWINTHFGKVPLYVSDCPCLSPGLLVGLRETIKGCHRPENWCMAQIWAVIFFVLILYIHGRAFLAYSKEITQKKFFKWIAVKPQNFQYYIFWS